jgi:hypothetical protein
MLRITVAGRIRDNMEDLLDAIRVLETPGSDE